MKLEQPKGPFRRGTAFSFLQFLRRKRFWKGAAWTAAALSAAGTLSAYLYIRSLDVSKLSQPLPEPTLIVDRFGEPASQLSSSRIEPLPLKMMPPALLDAVIAVEDKRFSEHIGIDVRAIGRAVARNVFSGGYAQGASTITQQLARNVFLSSDKTMLRKLKEAAYAIKIDMTYSKDDILETYLNSIYFGEGSWGVQSAAKTYFGKPATELTLPEAALLAALPKAPSRYSPLRSEDLALGRRNTVLALMKDQGKISQDAYAKAVAAPLGIKKDGGGNELKGRFPAYVDAVINEAVLEYGFTEEQLLTGGLRIETALDPTVQQAVLDVYVNDGLFPAAKPDQQIQSGAVVLDQRDGGIRALAGGRGDGVFRGFSHATQLERQPGSSFKPIAVYGPALERGYTPASLLFDGPLDIAGYRPQDWDHQTRGQVTMLEAIVSSWNIPPVWLLHEIGIDAGLQFAAQLGIALPKEDRQLSIALGGLSKGVSPLQMAQAYSAFAAQGQLHKAHTIVRISTGDGHVLIEAKPQTTKAMEPQTANAMTAMLQRAVLDGTGKNAAMNRPVAGKSGTTELPETKEFAGLESTAAKDAWFVGYTPELTAAVWVGYDRTDREHYLTTSGGAVPAVLFKEIMQRALAKAPVVPFSVPPANLTPPAPPKQQSGLGSLLDRIRESLQAPQQGNGKGKKK